MMAMKIVFIWKIMDMAFGMMINVGTISTSFAKEKGMLKTFIVNIEFILPIIVVFPVLYTDLKHK